VNAPVNETFWVWVITNVHNCRYCQNLKMKTRVKNTNLQTVGNSALKNPDWADYAKYCIKKENGLRKEAFKNLDSFIKTTESWTKEQRKEYIEFIFLFIDTIQDNNRDIIPQLLSDKLIKPILEEWCLTETTDSRPFRWYGMQSGNEDYLLKALEINPSDKFARVTLINKSIEVIISDLHHLPEFYIGEPVYDLALSKKVIELIKGLTSVELRDSLTSKLEECLELINNYNDWLDSKEPNFADWGIEHIRRTGNKIKTFYYVK